MVAFLTTQPPFSLFYPRTQRYGSIGTSKYMRSIKLGIWYNHLLTTTKVGSTALKLVMRFNRVALFHKKKRGLYPALGQAGNKTVRHHSRIPTFLHGNIRPTAILLYVLALAAHSSLVAGDVLSILTKENPSDSSIGIWHTDLGDFPFNANQDCQNPGVPNIREFCMNYPKKRAHFETSSSIYRCFKQRFTNYFRGGCHCNANQSELPLLL